MSIPDLKGLLETAQRIQAEVARVREELARKTVQGETGGGLCRCTANGKGDVLSITIDPTAIARRQEDDRGPGGRRGEHRARRARASWPRASCRRRPAACRCRPGCSGAERRCSRRPIARLVQQLAKLPGIGEKTAARLAFHILRAAPEDAAALAAAIAEVKQKIRFCASAAT